MSLTQSIPLTLGRAPCFEGDPEDDKHLRERVLMVRLSELMRKLIINLRPREKAHGRRNMSPATKNFTQPGGAVLRDQASHLNTFEPTMSIQHKFDGKLRRQKKAHPGFHIPIAFPR